MTTFEPAVLPGQPPPPDAVHPRDSSPQAPTSVSRLNDTIRGFIENWGSVWVEGEITSFNARGPNVFGRLKDLGTDATISFRLWSTTLQRIKDDPKVGDHVIACVKADYFVKSGDFTFVVSAIRPVGLGDQLEKLERLRVQLRREGLFDAVRKKPLPFLPRMIGLVTAQRSDAEKDVRRNAELRWPQVRFRVAYASVQGDRSVPETMGALRRLDDDPEVDVIIIARGGGDPQHLLGFSDERLVRAVAAASTPVVSAIGHENDHPLLDDVADLRASTPTDAAKRVVPDVSEQRAIVRQLRARLTTRLSLRVGHDIAQLEQLRSRPVLRTPEALVSGRSQEVFSLTARGRETVDRCVESSTQRTIELRASLRALSPGATLSRGYAIAHLTDGVIVRDADQAPEGTDVVIAVGEGSFAARSLGAPREVTPSGAQERPARARERSEAAT